MILLLFVILLLFLLTLNEFNYIIGDKKRGENYIMNERIKKLRRELDLTQQEFADKIGIKRGGIANYEVGRNEPTDSVISLICREFHVNEEWLRTGQGEMFLPSTREEEIAKLTKKLLDEETDSFKNKMISVLANLTDKQWETLAEIAQKFKEECENEKAD